MLEAHPDAPITADGGPSTIDVCSPDESVIESIRAVDPDVLCVALGNPKQERFIASYRDVLQCPVMIGIGGSLDMLVGDKKRAPKWAQRFGAEWVFRAAQEPGRLGRRYAHDLRVFGPAVYRYRRALRQYRALSSVGVERSGVGEILSATAFRTSKPPHVEATPTPFELNLDRLDGLSPEAHAQVISAVREAQLHDISIAVSGVSISLRNCFEDYGTWSLLTSATK
jgi:N-acetylglucosaminyldiphosphoundecaprenol N-acetyl-beta-D-mannosaminyltransferase